MAGPAVPRQAAGSPVTASAAMNAIRKMMTDFPAPADVPIFTSSMADARTAGTTFGVNFVGTGLDDATLTSAGDVARRRAGAGIRCDAAGGR